MNKLLRDGLVPFYRLVWDWLMTLGLGSYGGVLSLLYRQHYHDYIDGVISLSPITTGLISDPNDPLTYSWGEWVRLHHTDTSFTRQALMTSI